MGKVVSLITSRRHDAALYGVPWGHNVSLKADRHEYFVALAAVIPTNDGVPTVDRAHQSGAAVAVGVNSWVVIHPRRPLSVAAQVGKIKIFIPLTPAVPKRRTPGSGKMPPGAGKGRRGGFQTRPYNYLPYNKVKSFGDISGGPAGRYRGRHFPARRTYTPEHCVPTYTSLRKTLIRVMLVPASALTGEKLVPIKTHSPLSTVPMCQR